VSKLGLALADLFESNFMKSLVLVYFYASSLIALCSFAFCKLWFLRPTRFMLWRILHTQVIFTYHSTWELRTDPITLQTLLLTISLLQLQSNIISTKETPPLICLRICLPSDRRLRLSPPVQILVLSSIGLLRNLQPRNKAEFFGLMAQKTVGCLLETSLDPVPLSPLVLYLRIPL
jgi:hypothetical protein